MPKPKKVSKVSQLGKKLVKKVERKENVTLEISVNDLEYKSRAANLHEALVDFVNSPHFPFSIKTRVFVKFDNGKKERSRLYPTAIARRLFRIVSRNDDALELLSAKLSEDLA